MSPIPLGVLASSHKSGTALTPTFLQTAINASDFTTYTFTAQPLGSASSSRRIVVAVAGRHFSTAISVSSVTIGGVSAAIDVATGSALNTVAIASLAVPTGTTGDVVITFSSGSQRCGIAMWTVDGAASTFSAGGTGTGGASVASVAGGCVIAHALNTASEAATWTGITKRYEEAIEGTTILHSGGDVATPSAQTVAASVSWTGALVAAVAYA